MFIEINDYSYVVSHKVVVPNREEIDVFQPCQSDLQMGRILLKINHVVQQFYKWAGHSQEMA